MTGLPLEFQIAALALAASLALGLPVRLIGAGPTVNLVITGLRFARRRRMALTALGFAGSLGGLASMERVRDLAMSLVAG